MPCRLAIRRECGRRLAKSMSSTAFNISTAVDDTAGSTTAGTGPAGIGAATAPESDWAGAGRLDGPSREDGAAAASGGLAVLVASAASAAVVWVVSVAAALAAAG